MSNTASKDICDYCTGNGVVGNPTDDYFDCPKCNGSGIRASKDKDELREKLQALVKGGHHACYCDYSTSDCSCDMNAGYADRLMEFIERHTERAEIRGMEKAKSRVLRRTEIPKDAKNPTRDATVYLGERIAEIIQKDIDELTSNTKE